MDTKLQESFEYITEQAKQTFQGYLSGLLEVHGDLLSKIGTAKGSKKAGIYIELSEAEILSGHILETVSNLMGAYQNIVSTNRLLNVNLSAYRHFQQNDLRSAVKAFQQNKITKEDFSQRLQQFSQVRKPGATA